MSNHLHEIRSLLDDPSPGALTELFSGVLRWGRPRGLPHTLPWQPPLNAAPVAQLGGLRVLRIDWPGERLPNLAQRHEVYQALAATDREHLLCYVAAGGRQKAFVWARQRDGRRVELRTLPYEAGTPARTTVERLAVLAFRPDEMSDGEPPVTAVLDRLNAAFSVEAVTRRFFAEYGSVFNNVKAAVGGIADDEVRHLWTQRLLNRLMFVHFVQRKGWLSLDGDRNYLRALFDAARTAGEDFLNDRLHFAFFHGLGASADGEDQPEDKLRRRRGEVPYMGGGLFDREDEYDDRGRVTVPNAALGEILDLFERYNFTATESTPFDVEVAVDPEILGKVFEELVTGRGETGSYYTPRPIVAFMCREALKQHLIAVAVADAAVSFVDDADAAALPDPAAALEALRRLRFCDPACGSGAYLLGMMQELLRLREALSAAHGLDAVSVYRRKLEVIENNLHGVDLAPSAANIAMLRLWLSLAIDCEDDRPPPLPHLKFKIAVGDALTAPNPEFATDTHRSFPVEAAERLAGLKGRYLREQGPAKRRLEEEIAREERRLRDEFGDSAAPGGALDWRIAFVEVFAQGGFDIVLANPPYVRHERLSREYKEGYLKSIFPEVYRGTADAYVFFYARAQQILRLDGVACFISPNKWLRADYGKKLLHQLADRQALHLAVDFGELPVFDAAATFPAIFLWQKRPRGGAPTRWAVVKDLDRCYDEGVREHVERIAEVLPASQFVKDGDRFLSPAVAACRAVMRESGPRLGLLLKGQIYYGIKTGLNAAFVIDAATRARLVEDGRSGAVIKPLLRGDDVRRYEAHFRGRYLIFMRRGVDMTQYPAVLRHLEAFRADLTPKRLRGPGRGRKPGAYAWYEVQDAVDYHEAFERPKILYPVIGKEARFVRDDAGHYGNDKTFLLPTGDWYLLGVLNSQCAFEYLRGTCSVLGDETQGGRLEFRGIHMGTLPIPEAGTDDRAAVAALAEEAQRLHGRRRQRVERFLRDLGLSAAEVGEPNPLGRPWALKPEQFARRAPGADPKVHAAAREETQALTARIDKVEHEIDRRVAALYGLG